jgi:hypothetical protein
MVVKENSRRLFYKTSWAMKHAAANFSVLLSVQIAGPPRDSLTELFLPPLFEFWRISIYKPFELGTSLAHDSFNIFVDF